jgi:uncharacterized RDD family membrane protein YckC
LQAPPGFKSAKARMKFFIAAGLIATAVMALQALLQVWVASRFPAGGEPAWAVRLENVHAESAVVWRGPSDAKAGSNGDLWYVAGQISSGFEATDNRENNRLVRMTEQGPATIFTLAPGAAWLLPQGETLWIFASDGVSQYDGKTAKQVPAKQLTDSSSQPFLLDGRPAAVQEQAGARRVVALEEGQWVEKAQLFLGDPKDAPAANRIKVLEIGDQPFVFCPKGDTLYCHAGFPGKDARFPADWETVGPAGDLWAVAANEGRPEAFIVKMEKDQLPVEIVGYRREGATESAAGHVTPVSATPGDRAARPAALWKPDFSRRSPFPLRELGAASDPAGGCRVVYQALQWTVNVVQLQGEKTISARRYGDLNPADRPRAMLLMLPWLVSGALSIALAAILSAIMKIYRTDGFSGIGPAAVSLRRGMISGPIPATEGPGPVAPAQAASLTRRALALLLDSALVFGPLVLGMLGLFWILPGIEDRPDSRGATWLVPLLFGGALWAAGMFLVLCYTLGRWGRTPGKWAMGIRVLGMELAPCGFGRALLRSLLLIVDGLLFMDGFLNFSFGALLIACTVNRQRVGDMAARTLVVQEPAQPAPARSLDAPV